MKKIKKLLSVFLVGILSLGVLALFGCNKAEDTALSEDSLIVTPNYKNGIEIVTLSSETVVTGNEVYIQKTLQATITLADGTTSTECTWSVAWGDNALDEDVANYIKVSPQTNPSIVNVRCYKPFSGSTIIITARTNSSSASCVCEYVGIPTSFYFEYNDTVYNHYAELTLEKGTYTFNLGLENALGPVNSSFANFEIGELTGSGTFIVNHNTVGYSGDVITNELTIDMSNVYSDFITASVDGNVLTVNVLRTVNTYYKNGINGWNEFKDFYYPPQGGGNPSSCTVTIPVNETNTGMQMLIVVRPISNVTLDSYSLVF